ncbi:hypothetical protein [Mariprofundus ferrooxydans]|uniref:Uncharacterized protein n=1 Tax=Mariprofundus ferrooxydans PV-1 TaxID=314345 RepID=Q0EXJ8_9PROT|nr:hypothetical protein [Mariprofundus ferrooxydans]EAU54049.1 hypothetical protein SPV1_03393 [Mariprofundus ferrooxydans PV-1]KON46606.1 hypothetical protein AL013_12505 [Mariprofundus ferrooxydans]
MKIFDLIGTVPKVGSPLTVNDFEKLTKKASPYYQNENGKGKHYAVCPVCRNPIVIVNLYTDSSTIEGDSSPAPLHARHSQKTIVGIAEYDEAKYNECYLANPAVFSCTDRRMEGDVSNELLDLIINNAKIIRTMISSAIGLNVGDKLFESILNDFKSEQGHLYRFVNRYNLPYAIIYLMKNRSINYQYLKGEVGDKLKASINESFNKSIFISKNQIKRNDSSVSLNMFFTEHNRNKNTGEESLLMNVEKKEGSNSSIIFQHKIEFDTSLFINWINKDQRSSDIARKVFKK